MQHINSYIRARRKVTFLLWAGQEPDQRRLGALATRRSSVPRRDLVQPADVRGGAGTVRLVEGRTSLHMRGGADFQWRRGGSSGGETLVRLPR